MDMEKIENDLHELQAVKLLGYMSMDHFEEFKFDATEGLIRFGGSFAEALGRTLAHADHLNARKIMRYWLHECEQHAILYRMFIAKQKAEAENDGA